MANLDGRAAWILLTALVLTAVIGFEQGLVRALAAAKEATPSGAAGPDTDREPVPRAQPLSAAPIDEAQVRQIARQEAEAAIARSRPKKPQPAPDDALSPPPLVIPSLGPAPPSPAPPPPG